MAFIAGFGAFVFGLLVLLAGVLLYGCGFFIHRWWKWRKVRWIKKDLHAARFLSIKEGDTRFTASHGRANGS